MEVPGYHIEKVIGQGGMATVYLAVQESLSRPVVLKVMSTQLGDSPEFAKRFLNEGHLLASLIHPNVITIYDIGIAEDFLYISMEYLGGGDLSRRLQDGIPPAQALDILAQVGSALSAAHKKGIVHRDVKPANILYRQDSTPVLTDFGIAKHQGDNELTTTGTVLGSPFYMSPEQIEGRVELDGRSDIYGLGIIFYEMLVGQRPYDGESAINIVLQHLQSPIPTLPKSFERYQPLLNLMVAKQRERRFRDADALVEYVRAVQFPDTPESTRVLKRHQLDQASASAPHTYRRGEATQELLRMKRHYRRSWAILALVFLFTTTGLGAYFVNEINRYRKAVVIPESLAAAPPEGVAPIPPAPGLPAGTRTAAGQIGDLRREVATALQWLGRKSLEEERLTTPPENNAYYYYSRLLELDPGNPQALAGISEVARHYENLAESQVRRKNYQLAENYIAQGLRIDPSNKHLQVLRSKIQLREKSLLESLMELFNG